MLDRSVRGVIDGATDGGFRKVHVDSVAEAVAAVHQYSASALLFSPSVAHQHTLREIRHLVEQTPGVTAVAVLAEDWSASHEALLNLGACGVRRLVNLAEREGWTRLRSIVDEAGGELAQNLVRDILQVAEGASTDVQRFLAALVRIAPETTTVRALAAQLNIDASTLMSRFFRAKLPAPKMYLSMTRLVYAAHFLETPRVSIAATANALRYSSPQSFGRHIRSVLGLTAGEFRRELPATAALAHYRDRLIEPPRETLRSFRPLAPTVV